MRQPSSARDPSGRRDELLSPARRNVTLETLVGQVYREHDGDLDNRLPVRVGPKLITYHFCELLTSSFFEIRSPSVLPRSCPRHFCRASRPLTSDDPAKRIDLP